MGRGGDGGGFSEEQIEMYKTCFAMMDVDKDGVISKGDLRAAFDNVGKLMDESELDEMLGQVGGPCNVDNMIKMFQEKMAGGSNDADDLIIQAFRAYENEEKKICVKMFSHAATTWGEKFSKQELADVLDEFEIDDDNFIEAKDMIGLFVAGGGEKKEEAQPEPEAAPTEEGAAPAADAPAEGGKKKKKKKKAAK